MFCPVDFHLMSSKQFNNQSSGDPDVNQGPGNHIWERLTKCAICDKQFNNNNNTTFSPLLLPCCHSACQACVDDELAAKLERESATNNDNESHGKWNLNHNHYSSPKHGCH